MTAILDEQLTLSQHQMKEQMDREVAFIKIVTDRIQNEVLPENIKLVQHHLKIAEDKQTEALENCMSYCRDQIKTFAQQVEFFKIEVDSIMTKFKRIVSDQDIFKARVSRVQARTKEMVRVIRCEQLAASKMMSTLVELEFI